jgi:histone H3/H4
MSKKVMSKIVSIEKPTELSAEKVELGAIDDLRDDYAKIASKAVPLKRIIQKAADDLMKVSDDLDRIQSNAKKLQEMAKELGADNIVKSAQQLASSAKSLSSAWGKAALGVNSSAKEI